MTCDQRNLKTVGKWHRLMGAAGTAMPTACVPTHRCGTHAPGWLQGGHPTEEQGVVTKKVCFHWSGNCCKWSVNIRVRDCGEFYVYNFPKTPVCYLKYCAEQKGITESHVLNPLTLLLFLMIKSPTLTYLFT